MILMRTAEFTRSALHLSVVWSCLVTGAAWATPITLFTPAGLNPGDLFRFVFVTPDFGGGRIDASSSDIDVYNAFVNSAAAGATFDGSTVSWKAIGSTASVNAQTNVGGFGDYSVPVYLVDGTRVADNLTTNAGSGFWGTSLYASISRTIDGTSINSFVWTGSNNDGTAKVDNELGAAETQLGESSSTYSWLQSGFSPMASSNTYPMFAMSETLVAVPEPSTSAITLAGLACGGFSMWRRRTRRATPLPRAVAA